MIMYGEKVFSWREKKGLSQKQLATLTGIARPHISAIERGAHDMTVSTLNKIALALEVKPGELIDSHPFEIELKDRHLIDKIARSVVHGTRSLTPDLNHLIDNIASLCINLLEAHQARGLNKVRRLSKRDSHRKFRLNEMYNSKTLNLILHRIPKHL